MPGSTVLIEQLAEEIESARYREATKSFCQLVGEEERPVREIVAAAIRAASPYVQVPSHLMKRPTGDLRGVNYDHTILGWRGAISLAPYMPAHHAMLPPVQAMWYVPQGLCVWEQLLCEFPGHYARDAEKCGSKVTWRHEGDPDPFDGPAWAPARVDFVDHEPVVEGPVDDRFERLGWAISEGNRDLSYSLFLGLAADPANRERLKEQILFAGIIDLQESLINHGGYQNIGHKALRARAMVDLADYLGWDNAHEVFYTVVPDLGCSPRLYGLWSEINTLTRMEFSNLALLPKRSAAPLTEKELDELTDVLLWGGPHEVNAMITALFRRGRGVLDVADAVAVGFQKYILDVVVHPSAFLHPMHAIDYLNVVNTWIRKYDSPHQAKAVYMAARFMNDAIRSNAMFPRDPKVELPNRSEFRADADSIAVNRLLPSLAEAIVAQDAPRAGALIDSYLERTSDRKNLIGAIADAAAHFQNDPHILRSCMSSIEEWTNNRTSRRDDILRGWVKVQSRYIKRTLVLDCFALHEEYFAQ